ncbi:A24 family peptidase [Roseibium sp. SCP14]|uniref:A24 family peptidase n=1 Tax=Roseibium sp. SCP14 TaxID=3141375 RepID=UPI003339AEB5
MIEAGVLVIFPMLVAFGGVSDLLTMTIQNRVSILLALGFVVLSLLVGLPMQSWGNHGLALLVVFVPCFAFFAAGWMGGGDVKFISAIALWIGFTPELMTFAIWVTIYGMFLTLGLLHLKQSDFVPAALMRQSWFARLQDKSTGIPYGIAIAVAGLQIYPETFWFKLVG